MENFNRIKNSGELNLAGSIIPCYVTEDGTRLLSGTKMQEAVDTKDSPVELLRTLRWVFLSVFIILIEDWRHYDLVEKILFILIWSPLIHLFLHF